MFRDEKVFTQSPMTFIPRYRSSLPLPTAPGHLGYFGATEPVVYNVRTRKLDDGSLVLISKNGRVFIPENLDPKYQVTGWTLKVLGRIKPFEKTHQLYGKVLKVIKVNKELESPPSAAPIPVPPSAPGPEEPAAIVQPPIISPPPPPPVDQRPADFNGGSGSVPDTSEQLPGGALPSVDTDMGLPSGYGPGYQQMSFGQMPAWVWLAAAGVAVLLLRR